MLHTSTFARFEDISVSECGQSWEKYVTALSLWGTGFLCLGDPILIKHHWGDSTSNQWLSYRFGPNERALTFYWSISVLTLIYIYSTTCTLAHKLWQFFKPYNQTKVVVTDCMYFFVIKAAKSLYGQKMQNMSFIWARDCKSALCFRNCEQDIIQFFNFWSNFF